MTTLSYMEASKRALAEEMRRDATVWCVGEDLGRGGVFGHADQELKDFGDRFHNVTVLESSGAAGVLEALRTQGWLELAKK